MEFLISTYEAAATLGKWDRAALECRLECPTCRAKWCGIDAAATAAKGAG